MEKSDSAAIARDLFLCPVGLSGELQVSSQSKLKLELANGRGRFTLECKEAPEVLVFKRSLQTNSKGQTREVFTRVVSEKLYWVEPQRFNDFQFTSKIQKADLVSFFEGRSPLLDAFLGKRSSLDIHSVDFTTELHPKAYAKDYVNAIQSVE